jgi:hypothetical protein
MLKPFEKVAVTSDAGTSATINVLVAVFVNVQRVKRQLKYIDLSRYFVGIVVFDQVSTVREAAHPIPLGLALGNFLR